MARGQLNCGVSGAAVAFSETQPDGAQTGFDADCCRAVAAATPVSRQPLGPTHGQNESRFADVVN